MSTAKQKAKRIQELFRFYRSLILDSCEQEIGDERKWKYLRGRLLQQLSPERGLEAKVLEVLIGDEDDEEIF